LRIDNPIAVARQASILQQVWNQKEVMEQSLKWKVCGMRDSQNIVEVSQLQPDYMGFIFYAASPRYVGEDFVMPDIPPATKRVGVFVNADDAVIRQKVRDYKLDFVQLHGAESPDQCARLKKENVGVIKVFSVDDEIDFKITEKYRGLVDYFLFDTKGKFPGGNAQTFNWDVLSRYDQKTPFFLSGGIRPEHVAEIRKLRLPALQIIDINSGVELRPAFKDINKIKAMKALLTSK
jgi:phosphoribosylanthranilate isomerase